MTENIKKYEKNIKMSKRTHRCTPRGTCFFNQSKSERSKRKIKHRLVIERISFELIWMIEIQLSLNISFSVQTPSGCSAS